MSTWEIVEDDFGYTQTFLVTYKDGTIFDLTGYTVSLEIWSGVGAGRVIMDTLSGTLDPTPTTGRVSFTVTAASTAVSGEYSFHIKMVVGSSEEIKTDTYIVRVIEGAA